MKYVWGILYGLIAGIGGLFLFQNSTRMPSTDAKGYQLSLDLFVFGIGAPEINIVSIIIGSVVIGGLIGFTLPFAWKAFIVR